MVLFKLMTKKKVNTDIRQNFTHAFIHDVKQFIEEHKAKLENMLQARAKAAEEIG